jgi:hypothetical protein
MLKKIGMLVLFSTLIAGCSTPGPQLLRGSYYWTGDGSCESSSYRTDTSINCYNSDEEATGYRNAMTNQEMQAYKYQQQRKRQELRQAIKQFSDGLAQFGEEQRRRNNTNAYSYQPPALGYNSFMPSNEPSGYRSSTGRTYQYDLSDPRQRALYGADPAAKLRDRIEPDVLRRNDHNMGQYGGGILKPNRSQW